MNECDFTLKDAPNGVWDLRFIQLAELVSSWSKDPSTKVGAVIVDEKNRIVSVGYNGFPRGVADLQHLYADRDKKYERVLHAEQNAILFSSPKEIQGCSLYVFPFPPCNRCTLEIIQSGIKRVVSVGPVNNDDWTRWKDSIGLSLELLKEANIEVTLL